MISFSCFHSKQSILTNRLYSGANQDECTIKARIYSDKKETTSLGMTEYGAILGTFLELIGYAFKTKDENGKNLYVNKKSFCNLIYRLNQNFINYNELNISYMESQYNSKKDDSTKKQLEKIYNMFNKIVPRLSGKNIADISMEMVKKVDCMTRATNSPL